MGNTTSGCFSPLLDKGLVFAYVPKIAANDPGCLVREVKSQTLRCTLLTFFPHFQMHVDVLGEMLPARVLPGPPALTYPARERLEKAKTEKAKQTA